MTKRCAAIDPWQPVDVLTGIGPKLREGLEAQGVYRVVDLLLHLPYRYEDRSQRVSLGQRMQPDTWVLVWGQVHVTSVRRARRRGMKIVSGLVDDGSGSVPVVWFNQPWIDRRLEGAGMLSLYGPIREDRGGRIRLVNPEVNDLSDGGNEGLVPVYRRLGPLGGRRLRRLVEQALGAADQCADPLPDDIRDELSVPELRSALRWLHDPKLPEDEELRSTNVAGLCGRRSPEHRRLAFDELLAFACSLAEHRVRRQSKTAPRCVVAGPVEDLAKNLLPFHLTGAQLRVVREIATDLKGPQPMARLVQGDVGCGKTAVAALAMRLALAAGYQVALMAPTELLAEQHVRTLAGLFGPLGYEVHLLTSSQRAAGQRTARAGLADGSIRIVVGTHALIQKGVEFKELGLAVVDEQHRFGTNQRQLLAEKGGSPHVLVMTATPIPRSLALTLYGDLDLSIIDELPPGRRPVRTVIRDSSAEEKLYDFLRREVAGGGRAFVVFPMIEGSDEIAVPALEERAGEIEARLSGVVVGSLHGRMAREERESVTRRFRDGEIRVLLATTVVEVGVDVPEASMMIIEGADRFGLSQLHQLRGRVGRGELASWCVLMIGSDASELARRRLEVLVESTDGFRIAEADLELRGPGELTGFRQWGPAGFRFADLLRDHDLVLSARDLAHRLAAEGRLDEVREVLEKYHRVESELPSG